MKVYIDSNIPMYVAGREHSCREPSRRFLERVRASEVEGCTSTEVLQEILHRYVAIERRGAIQPAFDALLGIVDEVYPVELADVERAKSIVLGGSHVSPRDAIHLAVMERRRVSRILSLATGFDGHPGITRLG